MEKNNKEIFNFGRILDLHGGLDSYKWVLFIYPGHIDRIDYCKWLSKKIRPTHKVRNINIIYRLDDVVIQCNTTVVLIEFYSVFKTIHENYFNYNQSHPYIRIIKDETDYNKTMKYIEADNKYINYIYINIVNDNKFLLRKYLNCLSDLYTIEEAFECIINLNKDFRFEWSIYCEMRLFNEISTTKINISMPRFIIEEFYTTPTFYIYLMCIITKLYF